MSSTIKAALSTMPGANAVDRLCESKALRTAGKYLAVAAVTALVAASVLAIVAVSIPTAGAPAWIVGAATFFGSFSAPSLFGLVIPVKVVVYAWASLNILLAGCLAAGMATNKPMKGEQLQRWQAKKAARAPRRSPAVPDLPQFAPPPREVRTIRGPRHEVRNQLPPKTLGPIFANDAGLGQPPAQLGPILEDPEFVQPPATRKRATPLQAHRQAEQQAYLALPEEENVARNNRLKAAANKQHVLGRPEFVGERQETPFLASGTSSERLASWGKPNVPKVLPRERGFLEPLPIASHSRN